MSSRRTEARTGPDRGVDVADGALTLILDAGGDPTDGSEDVALLPNSYPRDWSRCLGCATIYPLGQLHVC